MKTYIPQKYYASFWKPRIYSAAYGVSRHAPLINLVMRIRPLEIELKNGNFKLINTSIALPV